MKQRPTAIASRLGPVAGEWSGKAPLEASGIVIGKYETAMMAS